MGDVGADLQNYMMRLSIIKFEIATCLQYINRNYISIHNTKQFSNTYCAYGLIVFQYYTTLFSEILTIIHKPLNSTKKFLHRPLVCQLTTNCKVESRKKSGTTLLFSRLSRNTKTQTWLGLYNFPVSRRDKNPIQDSFRLGVNTNVKTSFSIYQQVFY